MRIIETCPKCGHDLVDLALTTYPPIPQKKCFNCGWEWTGEREEVVRVPFGGNTTTNTTDTATISLNDSSIHSLGIDLPTSKYLCIAAANSSCRFLFQRFLGITPRGGLTTCSVSNSGRPAKYLQSLNVSLPP